MDDHRRNASEEPRCKDIAAMAAPNTASQRESQLAESAASWTESALAYTVQHSNHRHQRSTRAYIPESHRLFARKSQTLNNRTRNRVDNLPAARHCLSTNYKPTTCNPSTLRLRNMVRSFSSEQQLDGDHRFPTTRKRSFLLLGIASALLLCNQSAAYLPSNAVPQSRHAQNPFLRRTSRQMSGRYSPSLRLSGSGSTVLNAVSSSSSARPVQERLTQSETDELLSRAVELRRINQIEKELALRKKSAQMNPSVLARSRACGYGDDLHSYEKAVRIGQEARETLVTRNMGLVHYCVTAIMGKRQFKKGQQPQLQSLSREDLIQEGAIGLARAVDKWNPDIGGKFSTYAVYWIRAAVLRCIAEHDDLVRVPEHVSTAVRKMSRAARTLGVEIDGENILSAVHSNVGASSTAKWKEAQAAKALAEEAGLSDRQLLEAMKVQRRRRSGILSFESWMQQGKDYETDLSARSSAAEEDSAISSSLRTDELKKTLGQFLRPKELEALSWRYGLIDDSTTSATTKSRRTPRDYVSEAEEELFGSRPMASSMPVRGKGGEAMSFVEVGKKMKVSAEYGRRLCHAALDKLRRAAEEGTLLEPALSF